MKKFSIEILPKQKDKILEINKNFFNDVYVTHIPGSPSSDLIETSKEVLNNNLNPVPHIPARSMESDNELSNLLNQLNEVGVKDLLMIGGSSKDILGPFPSTASIIKSGILNKYSFQNIRIAGHPEGNPDDENAVDSLNEKLNLLNNLFKISIVTQFSLSASLTNDWIRKTRKQAENIKNTEIIIGLAGPSKITTLLKYAKVCGVNASTSFLKKQGLDITKLIKHSPEDILNNLKGYDAIHFFPFGGIKELNSWVKSYSEAKWVNLLSSEKIFMLQEY